MAIFKLVRLTFWAIGLMVGAGIYGTISEIVRISGVWAPAMFAGAAVVMFLNGLALAGTVRRHPHTGSILAIVRDSLHPWVAFLFELLRLAEGFAALCVTSKLSAKFAVGLVQGAGVEPPVAVEVAMLTAVAFVVHRGLDSAMDLGNLGTLVEVGGLVLVIAAGLVTGPAVPDPAVSIGAIVPGVREAAVSVAIVLFAFGGVQGIVDVAGEVPVGEKWILPWAVVASIVVTGLLYTAVCSAALSMVGVDGLARPGAISPLGMVLESVGFPMGTEKALALVSLVSVGNTCAGIFTFVSQIALSLGNHALGGAGLRPAGVYALMVVGAVALGQVLDVFALAERIGVMLLLTFVVVDLAFILAGARTILEKAVGSVALALSCALVVANRFA